MSKSVSGALAILGACALFGANSLCVKMVSFRVDPWRISLVRFIIGALLASSAIVLSAMRERKSIFQAFRVTKIGTMVLRAAFGFAQMTLFFVGVALTSSGRATLLMCTYPIFAALFGLLLFGERLPKPVFAGIALGFTGACVVLWDGSAYSLAGNLVCLVAGASNGIAMHFVRRVRQDHSALLTYLAPCALGVIGTSFAAPGLGTVAAADWIWLALIGVLAFLGQFLIGWGLKFLPATAGSLLGLSELIFALSLSAAVLGERMPARFFIGAFLILGGLVSTVLVMGGSSRLAARVGPRGQTRA